MKWLDEGTSFACHLLVEDDDTGHMKRILTRHLPAAMVRFSRKNRQYGDIEFELGPAAQYPELLRKIKLLRKMIWDNREGWAPVDGVEELLEDFIGHALMLLDCLALEKDKEAIEPSQGRSSDPVPGMPNTMYAKFLYKAHARAQHSYLVTEPGEKFAAGRYSITIANPSQDRCPWIAGTEPSNSEAQCLGVAGHADGNEPVHINRLGEAWEA